MVDDASSVRGRRNLVAVRGARPSLEPPVWFMGRLEVKSSPRVGAFTYFGGGAVDGCSEIGRYCSIAAGVRIGDPQHPTGWLSSSPFQYNARRFGWHEASAHAYGPGGAAADGRRWDRGGPVRIGNDVWIGTNAVILRDVSVGDGAVIAAGAVVTKDVEPYTIVGGVPAKPLRRRFDDQTVAALLDLAWWRFSPNQLAGVAFDDIGAAVAEVTSRVADGLEPYAPGFVGPEPTTDQDRTTPAARASLARRALRRLTR